MTRTDVINAIITAQRYRSYVEIGVRNPGDNYDHVHCLDKTAVDISPSSAANLFVGPSDDWFAGLPANDKYDCFFVDGDHREAQVRKDVRNAFRHLAKGGTVIMHDCFPVSEDATTAEKPDTGHPWNGQAYRVYLELRRRKDLRCYCLNADHGMGIVMRGKSPGAQIPRQWGWGDFIANAAEWLNLVNAEEWTA